MNVLERRLSTLEAKCAPKQNFNYCMIAVNDGYVGPVFLHEQSGGPRAFLQDWRSYPPETDSPLIQRSYPFEADSPSVLNFVVAGPDDSPDQPAEQQ